MVTGVVSFYFFFTFSFSGSKFRLYLVNENETKSAARGKTVYYISQNLIMTIVLINLVVEFLPLVLNIFACFDTFF